MGPRGPLGLSYPLIFLVVLYVLLVLLVLLHGFLVLLLLTKALLTMFSWHVAEPYCYSAKAAAAAADYERLASGRVAGKQDTSSPHRNHRQHKYLHGNHDFI